MQEGQRINSNYSNNNTNCKHELHEFNPITRIIFNTPVACFLIYKILNSKLSVCFVSSAIAIYTGTIFDYSLQKNSAMKKLLLLLFVSLGFSLISNAQTEETATGISTPYKDAVGIRLSSNVPNISNGISYKHFLNNNAVEAILSFGDGVGICGLYEIHKPIISVENLQWLVGFGGYVAFKNSTTNVGAAGIVGLDYKFAQIPLNLTLDWKPELNLVSKIGFEGSGVGLSARFTF